MDCTNIQKSSGYLNSDTKEKTKMKADLFNATGVYARIYGELKLPSPLKNSNIYSLGNTLVSNYSVAFDDFSKYPEPINGFIGVCCRNNNKILIDENYWNDASQEAKDLLIMHELGHCHLKRPHTPEGVKSIMNAVLIRPSEYDPKDNKGESKPDSPKSDYDKELIRKTPF
ncbi:MAG: hypothetical protein DRQ88_08470 [Epsilonproteobacteria bacterium]|nr:MAG: hypothetical protein DRQ88_08470 [Campylobacterota bacterium]